MATKSANVTARVQPEIKQKAEAILADIGLPVHSIISIPSIGIYILFGGHILIFLVAVLSFSLSI